METCPACGKPETPDADGIHRCHSLHDLTWETRKIGEASIPGRPSAPIFEIYYVCKICGVEFVPKDEPGTPRTSVTSSAPK